jgi:hypothetical protein
MSKLSDAIRRVQRIDAAPMGFGAARATAKATLLVGVMTPAAGVKAAWEKGADIVIVDARTGTLSAADVKKAAEGNSQAPLGAWQANPSRELAAELQKAGLDFLLLSADATPAETLLVEDLGFVLALPEEPEELFLRALEGLNLDGLLLNRVPSPLTVAGQLDLNKISMLGRRPLVCEVPASASKSDLECLRAAGCAMVLVSSADAVTAVKETVVSLPAPRRPRREERPVVSLPRQQAPAEHDEDDDDDD